MRYEKGHKAASRRRILEMASRRFRREGADVVGIASLMADAGLTHGGFYSHFGSREELMRDALATALQQTFPFLEQTAQSGGVPAIIHAYLDVAHRDTPDHGCAIACLGAEIARHPPETRAVLTHGVEKVVNLIAAHLPDPDPHQRLSRAMGIFASMVGTLQLARLASDPRLSKRILRSGEEAALLLVRG